MRTRPARRARRQAPKTGSVGRGRENAYAAPRRVREAGKGAPAQPDGAAAGQPGRHARRQLVRPPGTG
eukprot:10498090-Lingulodinium_polyedra.AAC.1